MTSTARPPAHQVSRAVATINDVLDEVSGAALWSMDPAETADTLKALTRLASRTAELELRVAAHADTLQVGAATGVVSTANWWAHHTRQDRLAAHKAMRLAQALDTRFEKVRVAMGAGDVSVEQATVIVRGLGALPADPDPALVTQGRGAADRARRGPRPARVAEPRPRHPDDRGTGDR